ncbi:hypothetical protein GURKE_05070 [Brevundimonas phage vB_BpoS-Gurke]|uniref:Uncharacterized protein n=1 Tax=Brevundimonas phage vB_BpoS-Gurke TaxID=2948599 RepID=A0A9E7N276_9CAUD|nr:hypothetical protein GURKE_05070 [Brevundimonas phage vB_BpoS-Gurke]
MPELILDTTGEVCIPLDPPVSWAPKASNVYLWERDLDAFTQGYIIALFQGWSLAPQTRSDGAWDWMLTDLNESEWWCDDKPAAAPSFRAARFTDLAPETLARIIADCDLFRGTRAFDAYAEAMPETATLDFPDIDSPKAGHDFWLSRNGHGAGFFDGGWPSPHGTALQSAAEAFGTVGVYIGDDGKVYLA